MKNPTQSSRSESSEKPEQNPLSAFGTTTKLGSFAKKDTDPAPTSRREQNREQMPKVAAFIDEMRQNFKNLKVLYAEEGGIKKGRQPWKE